MTGSILFAFGAMILWGLGDFLIQRSVRKIGALEILFWITAGSSVLLLPLAWNDLKNLNQSQVFLLLGLGLLVFLSAWAHFRALKIGKLAVVESILSVEFPVTVLLGLLFFHEYLNWIQTILLVTIFIGIILVSIKFSDLKAQYFLEKGARLAIISGLIMGVINFSTAWVAKDISPVMGIYLPWLAAAILAWLFMRRSLLAGDSSLLRQSRPTWGLILLTVLTDIIAWICFVLAVRHHELAITISITESYVVVALLLGVWLNKENIRPWQYVGASLAISGSLLIGFLSF